MKHAAAKKLNAIGNHLKKLALEVENGNYHLVKDDLHVILRALCDEIVKWNKEYNIKFLSKIVM